ncbi:hypothetical protein DFH06DRAFT_1143242 [Mycena polygramma]|nr:hypothetical protein DFH06DRAFT_1143242 [Mycena polygramma]
MTEASRAARGDKLQLLTATGGDVPAHGVTPYLSLPLLTNRRFRRRVLPQLRTVPPTACRVVHTRHMRCKTPSVFERAVQDPTDLCRLTDTRGPITPAGSAKRTHGSRNLHHSDLDAAARACTSRRAVERPCAPPRRVGTPEWQCVPIPVLRAVPAPSMIFLGWDCDNVGYSAILVKRGFLPGFGGAFTFFSYFVAIVSGDVEGP